MNKIFPSLIVVLAVFLISACYPEYTYDEAVSHLYELVGNINYHDMAITQSSHFTSRNQGDLLDTLPDIDKYPINVEPRTRRGAVITEIFVSTEKSGKNNPDNWLTLMAEKFNDTDVKLSGGQTAQVRIRSIASGTGYQFIASGKYVPDAYSPSNDIWVRMVESYGLPVKLINNELVGNIAGIVMKDEIYKELEQQYNEVNIPNILDAVIQQKINMGYTNPFASSTGLNFLVTVLEAFAGGDAGRMLDEDIVSTFEAFQQGVPFIALTTLQMRDSVQQDGSLDAFVMEYQTYINESSLGMGYKFIPFGFKHNNPLYAVGNIDANKLEVLNKFSDFLTTKESKEIAYNYGFNRITDYAPPYSLPPGDVLIAAQNIWKEKKDAGRPVLAVFVSDVSGSMASGLGGRVPIDMLKRALSSGSQFINENNYIGLVTFSDEVIKLLDLKPFDSLQHSRFLEAVRSMSPGGGTAMYDGITIALQMLTEAKADVPNGKPMIFVLTDGETNNGLSLFDVYGVIDGLNVPIYSIGYNANLDVLQEVSSINEAAMIKADDENISYIIGSLLNAQM